MEITLHCRIAISQLIANEIVKNCFSDQPKAELISDLTNLLDFFESGRIKPANSKFLEKLAPKKTEEKYMNNKLDEYNYIAINLLEKIGYIDPAQDQINDVEKILKEAFLDTSRIVPAKFCDGRVMNAF